VIVRRGGIPCTDPARTVLDLAGVVSPVRLEHAVDDFVRRDLVTHGDLEATLMEHCRRGRNGCGPLRALLDERIGSAAVPDSAWNRDVARLLTRAGLPAPRFEYPVRVDGHDYRIDLAYPDERLAIELDSVRWHLNRRSFDSDPVRRNRLGLAGWRVLTFTHRFFRDSPELLTASVRGALRDRSRPT
jgi:very-short-patch-repair endonuclease